MFEWHSADISEISLEFGTDIKVGRINLDSKRKRKSNNNIFRVAAVDSGNIIRKIASDASLMLLAVTYFIAAFIGFHFEALVAIPILIVAFVLSCYIRYSSEKRIYGARSLLHPKAKIIENGKRISLNASDVELGDLIYFSQGDIIPADARLVSSENLYVAERFYNKSNDNVEYKRILKSHEALYIDGTAAESYENMIYAGSAVISGRGSAIVTSIGPETRVGKTEKQIDLVDDTDNFAALNSFCKYAKVFSLIVLLLIVPIAFLVINLNTLNGSAEDQTSLLYIFLIMLSVAVTSMGELIVAPSAIIISKTLFGSRGKINNGITKLSSIETIANTDTLLILCPEILIDRQKCVRRVFFSDKEYRFDSLKSDELDLFTLSIETYVSRRNKCDPYERKILSRFVKERNVHTQRKQTAFLPSFIESDDINILYKCGSFRTEGGSQWQFDDTSRQKVVDYYHKYLQLGLKICLFVSVNDEEKIPVFEGMLAIGEEYPFSDGKLYSECKKSGITPVLVLEAENDATVRFALNCGIVNDFDDVLLASKLAESGKLLSDMTNVFSVYIGFGRKGTKEIADNLTASGRKLLPVIKDLPHKTAILPNTVYATHNVASYESVRYNSSMTVRPADAEKRSGGLADALQNIRNSFYTRYKLQMFKYYLTFATVFRMSLVVMTMISHSQIAAIPAWMILISGLLTDFVALLAVSSAKCGGNLNIKHSKVVSNIIFAGIGICIAVVTHITVCILVNVSFITAINSPVFVFYASIIVQLFALGAFLLKLNDRINIFSLNYCYILSMMACWIYLVSQNWFSNDLYNKLKELSYAKVELRLLPFLLIFGVLSFVLIFLLDKLFTRLSND